VFLFFMRKGNRHKTHKITHFGVDQLTLTSGHLFLVECTPLTHTWRHLADVGQTHISAEREALDRDQNRNQNQIQIPAQNVRTGHRWAIDWPLMLMLEQLQQQVGRDGD